MKNKPINIFRNILTIMAATMCINLSLVACDDGNLDTFKSSTQLMSEVLENPNQHVFLNVSQKWKEPVYVCFYSFVPEPYDGGFKGEFTSLTPTPVGVVGTQEGIPFGEFAVVEAPVDPRGGKLSYSFVANNTISCDDFFGFDELVDPDGLFPFLDYSVVQLRTDNDYFAYNVMAMYDEGDSFMGLAWGTEHQLKSKIPESGKTAIKFYLDVFHGMSPYHKVTVCWDPDNEGAALSQTLMQLDSASPKEGEFSPVNSGTIHVHYDYIDCSTANYQTALATLEVPFSTSSDTNLSFDAGSATNLFIVAGDLKGISGYEDQFTIVPLMP